MISSLRIGLFCLLINFCIISTAFCCGDFPAERFDDLKDERLTGKIFNPNYGYSVVIPKGLVGYKDAAPNPYHGFGIILSWEPRSYLFVDGSYNPEYESLEDAEDQYLTWLRDESGKIISVAHSATKLGNLQAIRHVAQHTCPNISGPFINDYTLAFSKDGKILYKVALLTTVQRYKKDKRILEELLKTWELQPIK